MQLQQSVKYIMERLKRNMRHVLAIQRVENRMQNKLNACNRRRGKIKPRRKYLSFFINQARFQILARFCKTKQQIQNLTLLTFQKMCTLIKIGQISRELRSVKDGHPCFVLCILKKYFPRHFTTKFCNKLFQNNKLGSKTVVFSHL